MALNDLPAAGEMDDKENGAAAGTPPRVLASAAGEPGRQVAADAGAAAAILGGEDALDGTTPAGDGRVASRQRPALTTKDADQAASAARGDEERLLTSEAMPAGLAPVAAAPSTLQHSPVQGQQDGGADPIRTSNTAVPPHQSEKPSHGNLSAIASAEGEAPSQPMARSDLNAAPAMPAPAGFAAPTAGTAFAASTPLAASSAYIQHQLLEATPLTPSAIAARIVQDAGSGAREVLIRLDPQELGRVEVRLTHSANGFEATLFARDPRAAEALQRDVAELKLLLTDGGLRVDGVRIEPRLDASVSARLPSGQGEGGHSAGQSWSGTSDGRRRDQQQQSRPTPDQTLEEPVFGAGIGLKRLNLLA